MSSKILRALLVAAAALALLALVWLWSASDNDGGKLILSGNIELTQVSAGFKIAGKLVEITFEEGQAVEAGTLLARLDDTQLSLQRDQAQAGLQAARSRLQELQAQLSFQRESTEAQIEQRKAELAQAQAGLDAALAGSRAQEVDQARAAVARSQSFYEKTRSDWERAQKLTVEKDISRAQYDDFRAAFEAAAAGLEEARERLALVEEGPRKEEIEAARAQVARAQAGVRQGDSQRLDLIRISRSIETTQAEVKRAEAQLAQLESQLADTEVFSPLNGVVLVKSAEPGEVLPLGAPVATIGDLGRPWMRAYIPASALGRIRLGQSAIVRTDSHPGKEYSGVVTFISPEAEFTPKQIQTSEQRTRLVYRIKIQLDNPDQELKLNMPCEAEIELAAVSQAEKG